MQNETLESVTQAISYEGYDMTAKVPNGKIAAGIIGLVVILAFVIATIILIRKKQKLVPVFIRFLRKKTVKLHKRAFAYSPISFTEITSEVRAVFPLWKVTVLPAAR